ncbi:MAG: YceI family protein [Actinomycetes bacterium]
MSVTTPALNNPTTGSDYSQATGTWTIDASHSSLGFSVRHAMVAKTRGRFNDFEGTITLDGANPTASTAAVTIKSESFDTQSAERDAHIKSADFLDVEQYPELTFASSAITVKGEDEFVLVGDLTVRGVTRPVSLDVQLLGVSKDPWGGTRIGFEAETEISRKDFGLTWNVALETGGVLVGDKVKITIDVEAVKQES